MNRKHLLKTVFLMGLISACAHGVRDVVAAPPQERKLYEEGLKAFSSRNYPLAEKKFGELLKDYPSTRWISGATYNWGLALESQGKFSEALEKYKYVVDFNSGVPSRDSADALYRISVCYENLGEDGKAVLALLQLNEQAAFVSRDVAEVELPARIAGCYARLGQMGDAQGYYEKAKKGLSALRRPSLSGDLKLWLPKTLYSMGKLVPPKAPELGDFKNYLLALEQSQVWLLRAAELGDPVWSDKASQELIENYDKAVQAILDYKEEPNEKDPLLSQKRKQETQKAMAMALDQNISRLKVEKVPMEKQDKGFSFVDRIFKKLALSESRVDQIISSRDVRDKNTPEAEKFHKPNREGKIIEKGVK